MKELHEPSVTYTRNTELPMFFGQPMLKGTFIELEQDQVAPGISIPRLYYKHPHGEIWNGDAITWLSSLDNESVDLLFADPPYNINKAEWDTFLGSGTTAVVSEQLGRRWMGCDISPEYCRWGAERIELVEDWPVDKWIRYDLENTMRRKSIR